MKNFGFQKMDEMEQQITLRACRAAWVFLVLALFLWEVWELIQGGDTNLPAFLLGTQVVIFCLAQWLGRARGGDDRVKREVVIWIILTAALVLFGVLLLSHGIAKVDDFAALSEVFPDPLGLGSRISLTLAIFGELFCSVGFIVGAFYRLALIPMIFTMCVALFVVHGNDPFAVKELAAIYLSVFVLMYISGPGNYALDRLIAERLRN